MSPFDATWSAEERGLHQENVVGSVEVTEVINGTVTTSEPMPNGTQAYLIRSDEQWSGQSGFAFARVLVGADGQLQVPHYKAVDIAWDNRLMAHQSWTSLHTFQSTCTEPEVHAQLWWRRFPYQISQIRGWDLDDRLMTEVRR